MPAPATMSCRLTEGRELRGLSVAEFAEQVGVTRQSIYKYENGTQVPSEETIARICDVLKLPASFFSHSSPIPDLSSRPIFFRDMKSNEEKNRKMSYRWLQILREQVELYESYLDFPPVRLPELELPDVLDLTNEDIDIAAESFGIWAMARLTMLLSFSKITDSSFFANICLLKRWMPVPWF